MRFPSPGSAQGYYSYNFLNLMSYSKFIFKCVSHSRSAATAPVLLASVPLEHANFINKSIYNALEGTSAEAFAYPRFSKPNKC